jgi:hypothetical protein
MTVRVSVTTPSASTVHAVVARTLKTRRLIADRRWPDRATPTPTSRGRPVAMTDRAANDCRSAKGIVWSLRILSQESSGPLRF